LFDGCRGGQKPWIGASTVEVYYVHAFLKVGWRGGGAAGCSWALLAARGCSWQLLAARAQGKLGW